MRGRSLCVVVAVAAAVASCSDNGDSAAGVYALRTIGDSQPSCRSAHIALG